MRTGAVELLALFQRIGMSVETFEFRAYTRLKQLQHLLQTGQIDKDFYWSLAGASKAEDHHGARALTGKGLSAKRSAPCV